MSNVNSEHNGNNDNVQPDNGNLDLGKNSTAPDFDSQPGYAAPSGPPVNPYVTPQPQQGQYPPYEPAQQSGLFDGPQSSYNNQVGNANNFGLPENLNRNAILSFIFSIASVVLGLFSGGFLTILAIPGVVLGHMAYKKMKPNEEGRGFALAGIIIGYVVIGLVALGILLLLLFLLMFGAAGALSGW
jgi:hypothetical protein